VRRLFEKLGHSVMKLKRIVYGPFKLGRLQVGQLRVLTQKEYQEARIKVLRAKEAIESASKSTSKLAPKPDRSNGRRPASNRSEQGQDDRAEQTGKEKARIGQKARVNRGRKSFGKGRVRRRVR